MRIISQDGSYDIPYEHVVIQRYKDYIYFLNKNLTGVEELIEDIAIAKYSTEYKAKKAMGMLVDAYDSLNQPKVFKFPKDEEVDGEYVL